MSASTLLEQLSATLPTFLPLLLDAAIKGLAILALTALAILTMRRSSAAARHLVWFLGAASLLLLPFLSAVLPGWYILPRWAIGSPAVQTPATPALSQPATPSPTAPLAAPDLPPILPAAPPETAIAPPTPSVAVPLTAPQSSPSLPWQAWVLAVWLGVSLLLVAHITLGFLSLWWLEHRASRLTQGDWPALLRQLCAQLGLSRPVELLSSPRRTMPMTWGLWRTRLLMPADADTWPADERRTVLLHELAHAKRWDCLTQLVVQLVCALYWFNPLVWLAWRRMQTERERACDDLVLSTGAKASAYAEQLLQIASDLPVTRFSAAAIAMARPSKLEDRLMAILDVTRNRRALTWGGIAAVVLLLGIVVLPLSALRSPTLGIIDAPGSYASPNGVASVLISTDPGGAIVYELVFDSSRAPSAKTIETRGAFSDARGWCMAWDEADRLWMFQPHQKAIHRYHVSQGNIQFADVGDRGGWEGIPPTFLARLPRALRSQQAKFLAAHPPTDRLVGPVLTAKARYQQGERIAIRLAFDSAVNWELQEGFESDAQDASYRWKHWFWRINGEEIARFGPVLFPTRGSSTTYRNVEGELGVEFPPGRYSVEYVGRDLPILRDDGTRLVAKEIVSNQIEFEVLATTAPATQDGPSQAQMQAWVLKHLATESCNMTVLRIVEWGQPEHRFRDDSWSSIRLKYIGFGSGWDGTFTSDRRFTFTANGDFVRSDYTDKQGPGETKSPELPFKTPQEVIASLHRQLVAMREYFPELADYPDQAPAGLELSYTHDCREVGKGAYHSDEAYKDTGPHPLAIMLRLKPEKAVGETERRQEQPTFLPNLRLFKWEGFHAGPNTTPRLKDKIGGLLSNHTAVLLQLDRPGAAATEPTMQPATQPAATQSTTQSATQPADLGPTEAAAHIISLLQAGRIDEVMQLLPAGQRTAQTREFLERSGITERVRVVDGRQVNSDLAVVILEVPRSNLAPGVKYITRKVVRREGRWMLALGTDSINPDDPGFDALKPWLEQRYRQLAATATQATKQSTTRPASLPTVADEDTWGPPRRGLRSRWVPPAATYPAGSLATIRLEVQNISDQPAFLECRGGWSWCVSYLGKTADIGGILPEFAVDMGKGTRLAIYREIKGEPGFGVDPQSRGPYAPDDSVPGWHRLEPRATMRLVWEYPYLLVNEGTATIDSVLYRSSGDPGFYVQEQRDLNILRCPPLKLQVTAGDPNAKHAYDIAWGPAKHGLQAGIYSDFGLRPVSLGKLVPLSVLIRNTNKTPIKITYSQTSYHDDPPEVRDAAGRPLVVRMPSAEPYPHLTIEIPPGEVMGLDNSSFTILPKEADPAQNKGPTLLAEPGRYSVTKLFRYNTDGGKDLDQQLTTGPIQVDVVAERSSAATQPAATLDFRIAAEIGAGEKVEGNRIPASMIGSLVGLLAEQGPAGGYDLPAGFAWFEVGDADFPHGAISGSYEDKRYILLMTIDPFIMLANENGRRAWGLKRVFLTEDSLANTAIGFELDSAGAERFGKLTEGNLDRPGAVLVDGKVVSIAVIRSKMAGSGIIPGGRDGFDPAVARQMVEAFAKGMPPTTAPATQETAARTGDDDDDYRFLYSTYKAMILTAASNGDGDEVARLTEKFNESIGGRLLFVTVRRIDAGKYQTVMSKGFAPRYYRPAISYNHGDKLYVTRHPKSVVVGNNGDGRLVIRLDFKPAPAATQPSTQAGQWPADPAFAELGGKYSAAAGGTGTLNLGNLSKAQAWQRLADLIEQAKRKGA